MMSSKVARNIGRHSTYKLEEYAIRASEHEHASVVFSSALGAEIDH
jgi:hypothetical protein